MKVEEIDKTVMSDPKHEHSESQFQDSPLTTQRRLRSAGSQEHRGALAEASRRTTIKLFRKQRPLG